MTRINVGIPVKDLSNAHLNAEHREIKRIPNHLRKHGIDCLRNAPKEFTLGSGHVLFLIARGKYTYERYRQIYAECLRRGIQVTSFLGAWSIYGEPRYAHLFKDYIPTEQDIGLLRERLMSKSPHHYESKFNPGI